MSLENSCRTAARILDCFDQPAMLLDETGTVLGANRSALALFAGTPSVVGRRCRDLPLGDDPPCATTEERCPLRRALRDGTSAKEVRPRADRRAREILVHPIGRADGGQRIFVELLLPESSSGAPATEGRMVGRAPAFERMMELVARVAPTETSVLLQGSSGTGKERVAEAIHRRSRRSRGAFVPVDCSGLPATLFESELFGHERGAFTGAVGRRCGLVEAARDGTLFLDEVGDIALDLQVKLLRLLESGTYRRVGGTELRRADFRLVCATHRDLESMVERGDFREDLYYRICAFPIRLPELRERREDIPLLVDAGLRRLGQDGRRRVSPEAMEILLGYDFPGNVRELLNVVEGASLLADGETIEARHLAAVLRRPSGPDSRLARPAGADEGTDGRARPADRAPLAGARPRPLRLDRLAASIAPSGCGSQRMRSPGRLVHASSSSLPDASRSLR